jgi:hypothetical protein
MPKMRITRVALSDAWSRSILGDGPRPEFKPQDEKTYIEADSDSAGRETSWIRYGDKGEVLESRRSEYGADGKIALLRAYFGESEAEVVHEFSREALGEGGILETERILYSGELDGTVERRYSASGILSSERKLDAEGEETEVLSFDEKGLLLAGPEDEDGPAGETVTERKVDGAITEEETRDASGEIVSREITERDERGRLLRAETLTASHGVRYAAKALHSYAGESERPSLTRVERWQAFGPDDTPRPLSPGFRMAVYDLKGRPVELLYADYREGNFEADSYYRIEYAD